MWLLKFHFAFSILCYITFVGFRKICRQALIDNGWGGNGKKKSDIGIFMACFVPLMNILIVILLLVMISMKKKNYDEMVKEAQAEHQPEGGGLFGEE